jgi:hypothetical protein
MAHRINGTFRLAIASLLLVTCSWSSAEKEDAPRTGYFKVEFSPRQLLGEQGVINAANILRSDDNISWQLYVPDSYDATRPAGVVVYVSPTPKGGPPRIWNEPLDDENLIWIGANDAGNRVGVGKRMFLAMLAPKVLAREYAINSDRIYVVGFRAVERLPVVLLWPGLRYFTVVSTLLVQRPGGQQRHLRSWISSGRIIMCF